MAERSMRTTDILHAPDVHYLTSDAQSWDALLGYLREAHGRLHPATDLNDLRSALASADGTLLLLTPQTVDALHPHLTDPSCATATLGVLVLNPTDESSLPDDLSESVDVLDLSLPPRFIRQRVRAMIRGARALHAVGALESLAHQRERQYQSVANRLKRAEGFTENIIKSSLDMIIATDTDQRIVVFNAAAVNLFGYEASELLGRPVNTLYASQEEAERVHNLVRETGRYRGEVQNKRRDGSLFTCLLSAAPIFDDQGELSGYMGISRDQSALRSAALALRQSEERYSELVRNANSIILRINSKGEILFFNEFAETFFGWRRDEIIGKNIIGTIVPPTETTGRDLRNMVEDILRHPDDYVNNENENTRKDGSRVWVCWTNRTVYRSTDAPAEILCIGNDITRLKHAEQQLSQKAHELSIANTALVDSNELLKVADQMKSIFLASMSHELRTPLNAIIGFTGILLQGLPGPLNDEQNKQLGIVNKSALHLLDLINEVLDISKIEAGRLELFPEPFVLREHLEQCLDLVAVAARDKGITIINAVPFGLVMHTDSGRLKQILLNLLSNAVKFTDRGSITVVAETQGSQVEISVQDTGVGIAEDDLDRLFAPFQQVHHAVSRQKGGTGLGLYLCRKLCRLLGGDISVKSALNIGTTFRVSLARVLEEDAPCEETAPD